MAVKNSNPTVAITNLSFTYPGIDGHPPLGSTALIDEFSLTLHSGDRCLLVGSNGAGLIPVHNFHQPPLGHQENWKRKTKIWFVCWLIDLVWFGMDVNIRENDDTEDTGREADGGAQHGSRAGAIGFSRHRLDVFWRSLLSRRGGWLVCLFVCLFCVCGICVNFMWIVHLHYVRGRLSCEFYIFIKCSWAGESLFNPPLPIFTTTLTTDLSH